MESLSHAAKKGLADSSLRLSFFSRFQSMFNWSSAEDKPRQTVRIHDLLEDFFTE